MFKVLALFVLIGCILADMSLVIGHAQGAESIASEVPSLIDLGHDGKISKHEKKPLILFFSLPECSYCKVVSQNYLVPLIHNHVAKDRPVVREVSITSLQKVKNFDQSLTTQIEVAKHFQVHVAPTVLFIDGDGNVLTAPIVGGDIAGLYGGYLDNAFAESNRKLTGKYNQKRSSVP